MNKVAKYVSSIFALIVVAYVGWLVIRTLFPLEEWFQQNPGWRTIFQLLVVVGVIGILSAIVKVKAK